ncbi:MAG: hypothetical protein IPJ88_08925 [Myxococcales bacterium]|nr:MAG: hypothetical protein IPJ88_08925 [Myxococcales bacterium]
MFTTGGRVTDIVGLYRYRGQYPAAVRAVRSRAPEQRRWRWAVAGITESAGALLGKQRRFVVEPVREMVLDMQDDSLRSQVVLDAWQRGVDLDRGEVLPEHNTWDLRRKAFLKNLYLESLEPWIHLPKDGFAPVTLAPVILAAKDRAQLDRSHAARLTAFLDDEESGRGEVRSRVANYLENARRWDEFSVSLCN